MADRVGARARLRRIHHSAFNTVERQHFSAIDESYYEALRTALVAAGATDREIDGVPAALIAFVVATLDPTPDEQDIRRLVDLDCEERGRRPCAQRAISCLHFPCLSRVREGRVADVPGRGTTPLVNCGAVRIAASSRPYSFKAVSSPSRFRYRTHSDERRPTFTQSPRRVGTHTERRGAGYRRGRRSRRRMFPEFRESAARAGSPSWHGTGTPST